MASRTLYVEAGLAERVHFEDFGTSLSRPGAVGIAAHGTPRLVFARSRGHIAARPGASLLELAEEAGLSPPYGCRRGLCQTCKCAVRRGTVRNEWTGVEHDARDEEIRLCIHSPVTDVTLDL